MRYILTVTYECESKEDCEIAATKVIPFLFQTKGVKRIITTHIREVEGSEYTAANPRTMLWDELTPQQDIVNFYKENQ